MSTCGAEIEANALMVSLMAGEDLVIPSFDLTGTEFDLPGGSSNPIFNEIDKLTVDQLTTRTVGGAGTFDALMEGVKVHLKEEYDKNRITGAEYAKAYVALTQAAIGGAVQYLLGKDAAYWSAVQAQIQAVTGKIQIKIASTELYMAHFKAKAMKSEYALTKLKLATESANYCLATFNLEQLMPLQATLLKEQGETARGQTTDTRSDGQVITGALGQQKALATFNLEQLLPKQALLLDEQMETARGQTTDTRTNGQIITGSIGKQKALYDQQITSYKRDSEHKAAKLFTDAWITQKTLDEGLVAPNGFTNASLDTVLTTIKANNNL